MFEYEWANNNFLTHVGKSLDELKGLTDWDLFPSDAEKYYRGDLITLKAEVVDGGFTNVEPQTRPTDKRVMSVRVWKRKFIGNDGNEHIMVVLWDQTKEIELQIGNENWAREFLHRVRSCIARTVGVVGRHMQPGSTGDHQRMREINVSLRGIATLMEMLYGYRASEIAQTAHYFEALTHVVREVYLGPAGTPINVETNYAEVNLELNRLQPCALILTELLTNALIHAFAGVAASDSFYVKCSLQQEGDDVILSVEDNGLGIDLRNVKSLYESKDKGLGLVQELTHQLPGVLNGPRGPNQGTRWEVRFPFIQRRAAAKLSGIGPAVLLVEDDIHDRIFYTRLLLEAGYSVIGPVDKVDEAIHLVNLHHPPLAVVDLSLHGDSSAGVRLVETLFNQLTQRTFCQVVFHTILASNQEDYDRAACIPAARFLVKNRDRPDVLTANLKSMLRQRLKGNSIFVCYAHDSSDVCCKFVSQIKLHDDHGMSDVQPWSDKDLMPGEAWFDIVNNKLETAIAAVLLIDSNFMESNFIQFKELPRLLNYAKSRGTVLVPVLLKKTGLALPDGGSLSTLQFAGGTADLPLLKILETSPVDYEAKVCEIVDEMFIALRWRPKLSPGSSARRG